MTDLRHELLDEIGVRHSFGHRVNRVMEGVIRPSQVHGCEVARVQAGQAEPLEADAIVGVAGDGPVGILTADCVPVLAAAADGSAVVAIHAGWRGLAAGVVETGLAALLDRAGAGTRLRAVVGPCIGGCCYEVDAPVIDPLRARFGADLDAAIGPAAPARPGHWMLDLGALVLVELGRCGVAADRCGRLPDSCTMCHPERFHSFRRDGSAAGRLLHWAAARPS